MPAAAVTATSVGETVAIEPTRYAVRLRVTLVEADASRTPSAKPVASTTPMAVEDSMRSAAPRRVITVTTTSENASEPTTRLIPKMPARTRPGKVAGEAHGEERQAAEHDVHADDAAHHTGDADLEHGLHRPEVRPQERAHAGASDATAMVGARRTSRTTPRPISTAAKMEEMASTIVAPDTRRRSWLIDAS